jgi:hypothetical protein
LDTAGVIMGTGGLVTVALTVPFEQDKLNAQSCSAVTVAPPGGIVEN